MQEPIDRKATLLLLDEAIKQFGENWLQDKLTKNGLLIAKQIVSKQPIIEAEPVRRGRWIVEDDCEHFIAKCSECGRSEDSRMIAEMPYCHCGARMDGGVENDR